MSGSAKAGTTAERHEMRAKDLDPEVRALASAPGHVCFFLTEDLQGCRSVTRALVSFICRFSGVPNGGGFSGSKK